MAAMTRAEEPIAVLTDHDHGQLVALVCGQHLAQTWITDEESGDRVGI